MKRKFSIFTLGMTLLFMVVVCVSAQAEMYVIDDGYVGGTPNNATYYGQDVIGNMNYFNTTQMIVSYEISTGLMEIDIFSTYFDNVGLFQTTLGDLFISSDGWNPFGSAPYNDDNYTNGEDWEYALVLDDHLGSSGVLSLYAIDSSDIITSDVAYGMSIYRLYQEVLVGEMDEAPISSGTWNITGTTLHLEINASVVLDDTADNNFCERYLGFHYAMTCGNDVIEGKAGDIPEPSSMALLALSLLGIYRKRKA